jgi:plasmid maintenance system antidote protein VapI
MSQLIEDKTEKLVEVCNSDWYRSIRPTISPGENLRAYRELHNWTQEELGERLGHLTRQNIANIETGRRPISKSVAKRLAEVFDVSVEKFL